MLDPSNKEFYSLIVPKRGLDFLRLRAFFIIMKNLKGVYIIGEYNNCDSVIFKVGVSNNILEWLESIQKGNSRSLKLITVLKHKDLSLVEDYLNDLFYYYRLQSGWFEIPKEVIEFNKHNYPDIYNSLLDFYYYCQGSPFLTWEHNITAYE